MEKPALPTGAGERRAIESLVFTLKEGFEFGEMARRSHENVLAEMLEKVAVKSAAAQKTEPSAPLPTQDRKPVNPFRRASN